jgi:hypothetical protein
MPPKHVTEPVVSDEVQEIAETQQNKTTALKNYVSANNKLIGAVGLAAAAMTAFALTYKKHQDNETTEDI